MLIVSLVEHPSWMLFSLEGENMKIIESILIKNPCYTAKKKIIIGGLMLHSVGCPQPSASVFMKQWNQESYRSACVHGFIDGNDGTVYQTLPWNHRGWHCGSGVRGSGNNNYIGVEMCEPSCIKYTSGSNFTCSDVDKAKVVVKRTYEAAVELFAMLCKKYSLNPLADGVIISHKEGSSRGIASHHNDPEHLWEQLGMEYTMDGFRKEVAAAIKDNISHQQIEGADAKWVQESNGRWWYRHADGGYTKNDWEQIERKWYHFDADGWMQTGWIQDKGKWYYLKASGEMVSNEILIIHSDIYGNEVYAFAEDGHMLTQRSSRGALV